MNEIELYNKAATESLDVFFSKAFRTLEPATEFEYNWHIGCICEHLMAVERGEITRLIINMPPRALKTLLTSVAFPAWVLARNPSEQFMLTSFKFSLAESMTRKTKLLMKSDWYRNAFPQTRIAKDQDQKSHFETDMMGKYYASAMTSVTGVGCNIQICDDPINPTEALSDTVRFSTNEIIRSTLFSRFNDSRTGRFILNMQRVHDDDPTGNLLEDEGWTHLKLPAEAKDRDYIIDLGRKKWELKKGELLFPKRFTKEVLEQKRIELGEYNYAGQYLQEPVPIGGGEFNDKWIQFYDPNKVNPAEMNVYILVDPAGGEETNKKKKKNSDWTAMMVVGLAPDNNYYLLDIIRDRLNPTERIETLFWLHREWNARTRRPAVVGYEKYGLMTDTHYIRDKQDDENYRFTLIELGGRMAKEDRIRRLIPDMQRGRWIFPTQCIYVDCEDRRFDLVQELIKGEMPTFPRAKFDDMLDALSRIYETELMAIFPKLTSAPRHGTGSADGGYDDWMDY